MNKKRIGELDGTPIVTGKKNYANEHEYYLTMNEDNTYQKLEQRVSGDKFRLVLGGGSGCNCGIPTIDKNTQPNLVWREPTEEDLAKFHSRPILQVADLPEGKLPLFLVMKMTDEGEEYMDLQNVLSVQLPEEGVDGAVNVTGKLAILIAEDWSLLGILGEM